MWLYGGSSTDHTNVSIIYSAGSENILKMHSYIRIMCIVAGSISVLPFDKRSHTCTSLSIFVCLCAVGVYQCISKNSCSKPLVKIFWIFLESYLSPLVQCVGCVLPGANISPPPPYVDLVLI